MKLVWIFIFSISTLTSFSQHHYLGIKGGVLFSKLNPDYEYKDNSFTTSFTGGITYDLQFENEFVLGAEILFSQYRTETQNSFIIPDIAYTFIYTGEYSFNYVSVPVKIGFNKFRSNTSGFINIGVIPSFLTSAKSKISSNVYQETVDIKSDINTFDIVLHFEFGIGFQLNENIILYMSNSYQQGLINIVRSDFEFPPDYSSVPVLENPLKRFGISFSLGLKYRVK
jgi:Outer membrane protein beta-barrel domain